MVKSYINNTASSLFAEPAMISKALATVPQVSSRNASMNQLRFWWIFFVQILSSIFQDSPEFPYLVVSTQTTWNWIICPGTDENQKNQPASRKGTDYTQKIVLSWWRNPIPKQQCHRYTVSNRSFLTSAVGLENIDSMDFHGVVVRYLKALCSFSKLFSKKWFSHKKKGWILRNPKFGICDS